MKKKIIHFIYDLGRGGAETMLVRVLQELDEYENIVVTMIPMNHFGSELKCSKLVCLNLKSVFLLPFAILKFRKLVKAEKPDLVHTHLYWPTFTARLTTPAKIPLITTIHAFITSSVEYRHWYMRFLDKFAYRLRKNIIIAVAKGALKEYFEFLDLKPYKAYVLYTFVDTDRFNITNIEPRSTDNVFRVISVGALRTQKNHSFLVEAFGLLKDEPVELHIYGNGMLKEELQQQIDSTGARVILKGQMIDIEHIIPRYDLYVMSSGYEGFSLSVLEAMALQMPLLLSDIPSFREQCEDAAVYFSLKDVGELKNKILDLSKRPAGELRDMGEKGRQRAVSNFTLAQHMQKLREIYKEALLK